MKIFLIAFSLSAVLCGCVNETPKNIEPSVPPEPAIRENVLASYSTKLLDKDRNRVKNIKLATEAINSVEILPQQVFSFRSEERRVGKECRFRW